MKRARLFLLVFTICAIVQHPSPAFAQSPKRTSSKSKKETARPRRVSEDIAQSANGWSFVKGEWVHPEGYKYVNGKVLRTTAKAGKAAPEPPGKLALENAQKLTPKTDPAPGSTKTAAEKDADARRKNLTPTAAPQTGTHL